MKSTEEKLKNMTASEVRKMIADKLDAADLETVNMVYRYMERLATAKTKKKPNINSFNGRRILSWEEGSKADRRWALNQIWRD